MLDHRTLPDVVVRPIMDRQILITIPGIPEVNIQKVKRHGSHTRGRMRAPHPDMACTFDFQMLGSRKGTCPRHTLDTYKGTQTLEYDNASAMHVISRE